MNWKLGNYLVILCLVSLTATTVDVHAVSVADKKKQSFTLAPKSKKESFIDFSKFIKGGGKKFDKDGRKVTEDFGRVKLKPKTEQKKRKKQMDGPPAVFKFGEPVEDPAGQKHTVSVEMVSLSLVSVSPVSLKPFLGPNSDETGNIVLSLLDPAINPKSPAKFDSTKKQKGTFDIKLKKKIKISKKKKDGSIKEKKLSKKDFKAKGVGFSSASPITITDPSFCLDNGDTASICLAPIPNPVPLPGSLALMAPALAILLTGHIIRRRRQNGGGPRLAA